MGKVPRKVEVVAARTGRNVYWVVATRGDCSGGRGKTSVERVNKTRGGGGGGVGVRVRVRVKVKSEDEMRR
jgi:hypothetical protein